MDFPGPKAPGREGARAPAPGLLRPSCSERGADSASQDTSLQSACEGGPCRPGPLYPLPLASPGPPQFRPGVPPGPSPWASRPFTGPDTLAALAAAGSSPPDTTRPRAKSRWGQGCHRPPACRHLLYPCKRGYFCGCFKCGVRNLPWGGCSQQGRLEPQGVVCSVAGWCSRSHPSPPTQIKARNLGFISVPFSRFAGNRLAG